MGGQEGGCFLSRLRIQTCRRMAVGSPPQAPSRVPASRPAQRRGEGPAGSVGAARCSAGQVSRPDRLSSPLVASACPWSGTLAEGAASASGRGCGWEQLSLPLPWGWAPVSVLPRGQVPRRRVGRAQPEFGKRLVRRD